MNDLGGNNLINVIMLDDWTSPATLVMYDGSTGVGNLIWLGDIQTSDAKVADAKTEFYSNDQVLRSISHKYSGNTSGKLMESTLDIINWNLKIGRNNEKILEIQNLGYNLGHWYENFACVNKNAQMNITLPGKIGSNVYDSSVTVPDAAVTLTTTFLVLINATLTNMTQKIKAITAPIVIDATYGLYIAKT